MPPPPPPNEEKVKQEGHDNEEGEQDEEKEQQQRVKRTMTTTRVNRPTTTESRNFQKLFQTKAHFRVSWIGAGFPGLPGDPQLPSHTAPTV